MTGSVKRRFLIYGAGAIGSVFGGLLGRAGHRVHLVGRQPHMEAVAADGLQLSGLLGQGVVTGLSACTSMVELPAGETYDAVLLCVKSSGTAAACRDLASHGMGRRSDLFVSLQNGLGNVEKLAETFGEEKVLGGRVIFGAEVTGPGRVMVSVWADRVLLGGQDMKAAAELARICTEAGIDTSAHPDIQAALWGKVLYNVGLNALSALLEVPYGALGGQPEARELLTGLITEAFAVAEAETALPWADAAEYLDLFYGKLLPATVSHRSSMLQDLEKGRETEVEAINGEVVRRGRIHGIKVPANEAVYLLVKARSGLRGKAPGPDASGTGRAIRP